MANILEIISPIFQRSCIPPIFQRSCRFSTLKCILGTINYIKILIKTVDGSRNNVILPIPDPLNKTNGSPNPNNVILPIPDTLNKTIFVFKYLFGKHFQNSGTHLKVMHPINNQKVQSYSDKINSKRWKCIQNNGVGSMHQQITTLYA